LVLTLDSKVVSDTPVATIVHREVAGCACLLDTNFLQVRLKEAGSVLPINSHVTDLQLLVGELSGLDSFGAGVVILPAWVFEPS